MLLAFAVSTIFVFNNISWCGHGLHDDARRSYGISWTIFPILIPGDVSGFDGQLTFGLPCFSFVILCFAAHDRVRVVIAKMLHVIFG